jgi:hypothetical protein
MMCTFSMRPPWRLTTGFIAASMIVPAFFAVLMGLAGGPPWFFQVLLVGCTISVPAILVFGLPLYVILQRIGWLSLPVLLVGATICGAATSILFQLLYALTTAGPETIYLVGRPGYLFFGASGGISALTFWWVVQPSVQLLKPAEKASSVLRTLIVPLFLMSLMGLVFLAGLRLAVQLLSLTGIVSVDPASDRTIPFTLGEYKLLVPANYLASAIRSRSIQKDMSLKVFWPKYEPLTKENRQALSGSAGRGRELLIRVTDTTTTTSLEFRFQAARGKTVGDNPLVETVAETEIGLRKFEPADRKKFPFDQEVYATKDSEELVFVTCSMDGSVPYPSCEENFANDGYLYHVTYRKTLLPNWREIREGSIALISSFKGAAPH